MVKVLDKKEKEMFFEKYNNGDITALKYLEKLILNENLGEEFVELVHSIIHLNYMNDIIETENYFHFQKFDNEIVDLYFNMRNELFESLGITGEDFEKYT